MAGRFWRRRLRGSRWIATSRADRQPHRPTSKAGGPAYITGLLCGLAVLGAVAYFPGPDPNSTPVLRPILATLFMIVFFGIIGDLDDRGGIGPGPKLFVSMAGLLGGWLCLRGATSVLALMEGEPLLFVAAFCVALATQVALNVFDNLDGVVATTTAAAFASFGIRGTEDPLRPVHFAIAGSSAGFLFWNTPPARLFLGNLGSSVIAGLASLVVLENGITGYGSLGRIALPFSWPLLDLLFVTIRRTANGRPPWQGGRDHTTHEIARRVGVSWIWLLALVVATLGAWWAALL